MAATSSIRPVFRSPELERAFRRDGYVVVPFAPADALRTLLDAYDRHDAGIATGYYASMHSRDLDYKRRVDREIRGAFWPYLERHLVDHEPNLGAFMIKHPGENSAVPPHQDWIVTDEPEIGGINCWFPVTPVDDVVGRMSVLAGSHRYLEGLRGSPAFPTQIGPISEIVAAEFLTPVDVAVGEAIIYDNRLLHGTPPNRSEDVRVVSYMSAIPAGSDRVHYHIDDEGTVRGYRVDRDFFVDFNIGDRPDGEVFAEHPAYDIAPLSPDDLRRLHAEANPPQRRWPSLRRRAGRPLRSHV